MVNDTIRGNSGDDRLYGGAGGDYLDGGYGDDLLSGGAGNDMLAGSLGSDAYVFGRGNGHDTLTDYSYQPTETDRIQLKAGVTPDDVRLERVNSGYDLKLTILDTGEMITVRYQFYNPTGVSSRIPCFSYTRSNHHCHVFIIDMPFALCPLPFAKIIYFDLWIGLFRIRYSGQ